MTDVTFLSSIGWTAVFFIAWAIVLYGLARAIGARRRVSSDGELSDQLPAISRRLVGWSLAAILLAVTTVSSYAYRPKNVLPQDNAVQQQRLQQLDASDPVAVPPASKSLTEQASWQEVQEDNIEENRRAVEHFKDLPDG